MQFVGAARVSQRVVAEHEPKTKRNKGAARKLSVSRTPAEGVALDQFFVAETESCLSETKERRVGVSSTSERLAVTNALRKQHLRVISAQSTFVHERARYSAQCDLICENQNTKEIVVVECKAGSPSRVVQRGAAGVQAALQALAVAERRDGDIPQAVVMWSSVTSRRKENRIYWRPVSSHEWRLAQEEVTRRIAATQNCDAACVYSTAQKI